MLLEELRPRPRLDIAHKIAHILCHLVDVGNEILTESYGALKNKGAIRGINTFVYEDLMLTYSLYMGWPDTQHNTTYDEETDKSKLVGKLLETSLNREARRAFSEIGWELVQSEVNPPQPRDSSKGADKICISRATYQLWIKETVPSTDQKGYDRLYDAILKLCEYEMQEKPAD